MKKIISIAFFSVSAFAFIVPHGGVAIKDKDYGYPKSKKEAVKMILKDQACLLEPGEEVKKMDSSWGFWKIRGRESGCIGWIPFEYVK